MSQHVVHIVEQLLARAPQWIRQDLMSNDAPVRRRAEETLAAMIAAALDGDQEPGTEATTVSAPEADSTSA